MRRDDVLKETSHPTIGRPRRPRPHLARMDFSLTDEQQAFRDMARRFVDAEAPKDLMRKLEKAVGFALELRDDPLLRPDEFKLVVKSAGRDVTHQYAVA